jgi:glycine cleavage system H protein
VSDPATSFYKKSNFVTHLPTDCLYSPSHFWLRSIEADRWRIGFTKFATRMLGDIVDVTFEKPVGAAVAGGEIIGAIEGFKAISDIYSAAEGEFLGPNPDLKGDSELIGREPYARGWLYEVRGAPDAQCGDLHTYRALLDATIDRMLDQQNRQEN